MFFRIGSHRDLELGEPTQTGDKLSGIGIAARMGLVARTGSRRRITATTQGRRLTVNFGAAEGAFESRVAVWRLIVWDVRKAPQLRVNGRLAEGSFNADAGLFIAELANFGGDFAVELRGL